MAAFVPSSTFVTDADTFPSLPPSLRPSKTSSSVSLSTTLFASASSARWPPSSQSTPRSKRKTTSSAPSGSAGSSRGGGAAVRRGARNAEAVFDQGDDGREEGLLHLPPPLRPSCQALLPPRFAFPFFLFPARPAPMFTTATTRIAEPVLSLINAFCTLPHESVAPHSPTLTHSSSFSSTTFTSSLKDIDSTSSIRSVDIASTTTPPSPSLDKRTVFRRA
ncbi:hypothetical protein JCM8547_001079 [Rhodosporidiobolus lusitaniae]